MLVGPDLSGVQPQPAAVITVNIKRMQDRVGPLTDAQVQLLTALLQDKDAASRLQTSKLLTQGATLARASPAVGRRLFTGAMPLQNGGPACISCHRAARTGGTLGPDLIDAFARIGPVDLVSGIEQADFPVMRAVFRWHPITQQEAAHLTSYLQSIGVARMTAFDVFGLVPIAGLLITLLLLMALPSFYRQRNTGVRARLVRNRR